MKGTCPIGALRKRLPRTLDPLPPFLKTEIDPVSETLLFQIFRIKVMNKVQNRSNSEYYG
jgi:hypothetical protein